MPTYWVVLNGPLKMRQADVNVALGLYLDEPSPLRIHSITDNNWLSVLAIQGPHQAAAAR
jgi:hypothetical protein